MHRFSIADDLSSVCTPAYAHPEEIWCIPHRIFGIPTTPVSMSEESTHLTSMTSDGQTSDRASDSRTSPPNLRRDAPGIRRLLRMAVAAAVAAEAVGALSTSGSNPTTVSRPSE